MQRVESGQISTDEKTNFTYQIGIFEMELHYHFVELNSHL